MGKKFYVTLADKTNSALEKIDVLRSESKAQPIPDSAFEEIVRSAAEWMILKPAINEINERRRRIYLEQLKDAVTELLAAIEAEENSWK